MSVVVRQIPRADPATIAGLERMGVATVHEAQSRTGLLFPNLRPIIEGATVAGSAVTVSVPPGDNWMIHAAVEVCSEGDVLVVSPTARSDAGYVGELIVTALSARGVRAVIIDAGCRDVAEVRRMNFPVWARCISALGTVKETLGDVNVPVVCAGQVIHPGDVIIADDDGVVVAPRRSAGDVLAAAQRRTASEAEKRARYAAGELSLDLSAMRESLARKGLTYLDEAPGAEH